MPAVELPLHMRREVFDPVPELGAVRAEERIGQVTTPLGNTAWLVTRHADIREVLGDHDRFSNVLSGPEPMGERRFRDGMLLGYDPPEHTRLRKMLTAAFSLRRMRLLEPRVTDIVAEHLDALAAAGPPTDLVAGFALPVPSLVICELLGVPYADREAFQGRTGRQLDLGLTLAERVAAGEESHAYMAELVGRARSAPGEDVLGMLVREHGTELTDDELTGIASLLLVAGHETTSNMLGLGTLALLRHPDQLAILRDARDPAVLHTAVEELMRWLSVVPSGTPRRVVADTVVAGQPMRPDDLVVCALPAANRDPELTDRPDALDIGRTPGGHLGFGHGVHYCLGAPLARMEMRIGFPALLRRFPDLRLAVPFSDVRFRSSHLVYGLHALPVSW
ncbi:cytochrome P450 [Pseudonocardia sp. H11422]|uniref:cytochrome P450 n=1 Tax=Pseudonocardia sp. H11422 TaxID=2835866 RepID=UPI001BDD027C|nr:cytochrome P450 [Pseudonocardia sp. H11422]